MPEAFNPAWEFWEPDAEIAEAMGHAAAPGFAGLGLEGEYGERPRVYRAGGTNFGFRFSCGDPDAFLPDPDPAPFLVAPVPRAERRLACGWCGAGFVATRFRDSLCPRCCRSSGSPRVPATVCVNCGTDFIPRERRYFRFCSPECGSAYCTPPVPKPPPKPAGRPRKHFARPCENPACAVAFRPAERNQRYCSRPCESANRPPQKIDPLVLLDMRRRGLTVAEMAAAFGATARGVQKALARLGAAPVPRTSSS